jgi:hypothetical protein
MRALLMGSTVLAGLLTGCSSIDRSESLRHARLEVGVATKSSVVDAIGLPARTSKDDVQHVEFWLYTGQPEMSSYFIPMPVARSGNLVTYVNLGPQLVASGAPVVLICTFDASGRLIDTKRPEEIKQ